MNQLFRQWLHRYFSDPQIIILGLLLISGFLMIVMLGNMLAPVLAAIVIAYLLEGIISRLQRFKMPRNISVLVVFCLFMACLIILIIGLLPLISKQIADFVQKLPSMLAGGRAELMHLPEKYPEIVSESQINQILEFITTELNQLGQRILTLSLQSVRGLITVIIYLVLVPLMVFFFLKDKTMILLWVQNFLPGNRGLATKVWQEVNEQIINYVRGKIWEIIIVWGSAM